MFYEKPVTTPEVIVMPSKDVEEHGNKAGEGDGQLNDAKADENAGGAEEGTQDVLAGFHISSDSSVQGICSS